MKRKRKLLLFRFSNVYFFSVWVLSSGHRQFAWISFFLLLRRYFYIKQGINTIFSSRLKVGTLGSWAQLFQQMDVAQWILGNISYYYYYYNYFFYYWYYCCHYYYYCDYNYYYYFLNQPNYTILSYSYKINVKYTLYIVQFRIQEWCLSYSRRNCLPIHPIVSKRFRTQMKN